MLISGGAKGADTTFEELSKFLGHKITIYNALTIKELSDQEIKLFDEWLTFTNKKYLDRTFPTSSEETNNLLRRNVKIALDSDVLYAVGYLSTESVIEGGTAWACHIFIEKCMRIVESKGLSDIWVQIPFYLFDQYKGTWYTLETFQRKGIFRASGTVPKIIGITGSIKYGGIGSRDIQDLGIKAIQDLYT